MAKPSELLAAAPAASEPVVVYTGPKKTGAALIAAVAVDEQKQTVRPRGKKKSQVASKKPDAAAEPNAEAKDTAKKPPRRMPARKPNPSRSQSRPPGMPVPSRRPPRKRPRSR